MPMGPSVVSWGIWVKALQRFIARFLHFSRKFENFQNKKLGEIGGCQRLVIPKEIDYKGTPGNLPE